MDWRDVKESVDDCGAPNAHLVTKDVLLTIADVTTSWEKEGKTWRERDAREESVGKALAQLLRSHPPLSGSRSTQAWLRHACGGDLDRRFRSSRYPRGRSYRPRGGDGHAGPVTAACAATANRSGFGLSARYKSTSPKP
jgi:hypothetical protein